MLALFFFFFKSEITFESYNIRTNENHNFLTIHGIIVDMCLDLEVTKYFVHISIKRCKQNYVEMDTLSTQGN